MNQIERVQIARQAGEVLDRLALEEPVIAIHGPRSVGKSTLLAGFANKHHVEVLDLDNDIDRDAAVANPSAFVSGQEPLCIDEYQYAPEILGALKTRLNRTGTEPGTAVLTGSTRQDALPRTAQALTGRIHSFILWPLAQSEIEGVDLNLISRLRDAPDETVAAIPRSTTMRGEYADRVCAGGFPLALRREGDSSRSRWFSDYVRTSIERDATELMRVRQRQLLREVLNRLALQTAQILNVAKVGEGLDNERSTIEGYIRLLEDLFLVTRLPAWGHTLASGVAVKPKIHLLDSGVGCHLLKVSPSALATLDPALLTEFGHLLETFVYGEVRKQLSWLGEPATVGHWRTYAGDEVDLVVEFIDGRVLAFEIKASERISAKDFRGLRKLRNLLGGRFVAGVAFSTGSRSYTYEDRLHVMPVDRLWKAL